MDIEGARPDSGRVDCAARWGHRAVTGVLLHDPHVELRCVTEPMLFIGALASHKPVERHGYVGDHDRHGSLLSEMVNLGHRTRVRVKPHRQDEPEPYSGSVAYGNRSVQRNDSQQVSCRHVSWVAKGTLAAKSVAFAEFSAMF